MLASAPGQIDIAGHLQQPNARSAVDQNPPDSAGSVPEPAGSRPRMLQARLVGNDDEFSSLQPQWDDLLSRTAERNVFLSHEWLHSWWVSYRPDATLRLVLIAEGDRLLAIAPMMLQREWRHGLPIRVLRFVGDGTWETDHMSFLVDASRRAELVAALLREIERLPWDVLELNQMPAPAATTQDTLEFVRARWDVAIDEQNCPRCILPASYDELVAALPSRFRTSLRSSRRKLEQQHDVEFGRHADLAGMPAALETLFRNHAGRWQAKGRSGVFTDTRRRAFYALLTERLLARDWLRFFFLKLDGRIVAQQYCFGCDGTTMLLQEGFDIALAKENVGNVLRGHVFEHLIGQGGGVYDFLAGESRHKRNWARDTVVDLRVRCIRRSPYGRVLSAVERLVAAAKDLLRPLVRRLRGAASNP